MAEKKYVYMVKKIYQYDPRPYDDEDIVETVTIYNSFEKGVKAIQKEYEKKIKSPDLEMKGIEINEEEQKVEAYVTMQTYKSTYDVYRQYDWYLTREELK